MLIKFEEKLHVRAIKKITTQYKKTSTWRERLATETIKIFFNLTYTDEMIHGIPPQFVLNADETNVEVSLPTKIFNSWLWGRRKKIIQPFELVLLKYAHKNLLKTISAGKITIGRSPNCWMNDNFFKEWSKWPITLKSISFNKLFELL